MRKLLLSGVALAILAGAAYGQVNVVPQIGVSSAYIKQNTYSASVIGLVVASAPTDIFCINDSISKTISIKRIAINGTAGTAITVPVTLSHHTTLDTGGTASTVNAAPNGGPNNSTNPTYTALMSAYTTNPTITDTTSDFMRTELVGLPLSTSGSTANLAFNAGEPIGDFTQAFDLPKAVVGQYCVNFNATTIASPVVNLDITWTEQ
jgi:hypothetical protein